MTASFQDIARRAATKSRAGLEALQQRRKQARRADIRTGLRYPRQQLQQELRHEHYRVEYDHDRYYDDGRDFTPPYEP